MGCDMYNVVQSNPNSIPSVFNLLLMLTTIRITAVTSADGHSFNRTVLERESTLAISDILRIPEALDADHVLEEQSRFLFCIPLLRIFNLELRQALAPNEFIGLTGSHKELGKWQLEKSIEMHSFDGGKRQEWFAKVLICANDHIAYRYFIYTLDAERNKRIRVWEGQQHPRVMESYHIYRHPGIDYFGEISNAAIDVGGQEFPWLRNDRLIELKFIWQNQLKVKIRGATQNQHLHDNIRLRLDAMDDQLQECLIEVSRYAYNRSQFRKQPFNGVRYNFHSGSRDIVIFRIMEPLRVRKSYKLRIFTFDHKEIGYVAILHCGLKNSEGILNLPVYSTTVDIGFEIGRLTLPYLIVYPLPQAKVMDMQGSFQHYWPLNWPTMQIGNRGIGRSFYNFDGTPSIKNTIESFLHLHSVNGDMVKLEVQLTRDYVPIVWHGIGFYTAPKDRQINSLLDLDYTPIHRLSYNQLKNSRVFVQRSSVIGIEEYTHLNVKNNGVLNRILPRLVDIYHQLPKSIGILIEITWPQLFSYDDKKAAGMRIKTIDKNLYVNKIISLTARFGCGRPLIFASFDADICTMMRYKQNIYPTIFLTTGGARQWQPYKDLRTQTFINAVNFVQSEFLLGTAPHVANFLQQPHKLKRALDQIQTIFLWGDELQNEKVRRTFQKLHVTGLIYDQIDQYHTNYQRNPFFGAKEVEDIFERQCMSPLRNLSIMSQLNTKTLKKKRKFFTIHIEI